MKLLITGGSGFLGRRTAGYFEKLGYEVLTPTHSQLDITQPVNVRNWFLANRPDGVIHTAAVSDTGLCQQKPQWSQTINVTGCVNLARCCRELGSKLVICSSDQVYFGSAIPGPHREEEPLTPANVYGDQKLRAEGLCLEEAPDTVCLRLSWMYDRERYPGEHGHFLSTFRETLADETKPISWPIHDRRGITYVRYVVENLPKALALSGGVYNFGSENDTSTHHTVKAVLEDLEMEAALFTSNNNRNHFSKIIAFMLLCIIPYMLGCASCNHIAVFEKHFSIFSRNACCMGNEQVNINILRNIQFPYLFNDWRRH